jgi:hypothetical protein
MQSRRGSLIESLSNVFVGLLISFFLNAAIFPIFGWTITLSQNVSIATIYTIVSIVRSYFMRRFFNYISVRFGF